jgi:hypothetical protein
VANPSYTWNDIIELMTKLNKGVPSTQINARICDIVSKEMYIEYPWPWTVSKITNGSILLVDGTQEYSAPTDFYRPVSLRLTRTDVSPVEDIEMNITGQNVIDNIKRSFYAMRSISYQGSGGLLRLDSAVQISSPMTAEIRGDYQPFSTKITDLGQTVFFLDEYVEVAIEGLLYWSYKLADDPRSGGVQKVEDGRSVYTGQYAAFRAKLDEMQEANDFATADSFFPDSTLGEGKDSGGGLNIFGVL